MRSRGGVLRAAAAGAACLVVLLAYGSNPRPALAQGGSGAPLEENLPRSWYRNFDYGVEVDGRTNPEVGLYQLVGKRYMLVYGPGLDGAFVLSFTPKVVRAVQNGGITPKNDLEVVLAESSFSSAPPIPWMQEGASVIFYADQKRYRVSRVPPLVGETNLEEIFKHNPLYKLGMEEYAPAPADVARLRQVQEKALIEVWFGSWCPHCQAVVPRFLKTLQAAGNPAIQVLYHGVPREFADYPPARARNVNGLPTFIFFRDGKEFGRLAGGAVSGSTLEAELARILGETAAASK